MCDAKRGVRSAWNILESVDFGHPTLPFLLGYNQNGVAMAFLIVCTSRLHDTTLSSLNLPIMPLPSNISFLSSNLKHVFSVSGPIFSWWESFVTGGVGEGLLKKDALTKMFMYFM